MMNEGATDLPNNRRPVIGKDGVLGMVQLETLTGDGTALEVLLADGRTALVPVHLLQAKPDGSYYLPIGLEELHPTAPPAASIGTDPEAPPADGVASSSPAKVMTLSEEQLEVHKKRVETGKVRVSKTVETHEEVVDVALERQEISIERVPVNKFVNVAPAVRYEGNVMIISLLEEVLVVEKRLRVREELRLTIEATQSIESRTVSLRSESAKVERTPADPGAKSA